MRAGEIAMGFVGKGRSTLSNKSSDGKAELRFAAAAVAAVLQRQRAAVGFCDLAAEDETDAGAALFCGEEGDEKVCGVGDTRAFIEHRDFHVRAVPGPSYLYAAAGFVSGVGG